MSLSRNPVAVTVAAIILLGAVGIGALVWTLYLHGPAPAAVGETTGPAGQPAASSVAPTGGVASTLGPGGLAGTWKIDTTIGSFSDFSDSFVGYRVNETLAGNRANEAVGRTPGVSGSLTLDGTTVTSVEVTADLTSLKSDDDRRDGQLKRQAIETDQFPTATFKLTSPIDLEASPTDGQTISASANGELTLHGVTRAVTIQVQAVLGGDVVTVTGHLDIAFSDYGIQPPTSFAILSVEDHGVMEFQLHFRHA